MLINLFKYRRVVSVFGFALLSLCLIQTPVSGQVVSGAIEGTITDEKGDLVAGATVIATAVETKQTRQIVTDGRGFFRLDQLPIGTYKINVTMTNFKQISTEVEVRLGSPVTVNLVMPIGNVSETVVIDAGAAQVELSTSEISRNVSSKSIEDLPVLSRNPAELLQLFPGVPAISQDKNGSFTVGGLRPRSTTYNVDGSSNNFDVSSGARTPVIKEAVQEFRALTNVFSAQYGKGAGAVIDMVLKSGTNNFHGELFEFSRNSALGANSFFNNARKLAKPKYISNIYGFTFGGPIKKDKTFFFAAFQGTNLRTESLETLNLPSNSVRTPITTNVGSITSLATDPNVAKTITDIFAVLPSCVSAASLCVYVSNQARPTNEYLYSAKFDHNFTSKDTLTGRVLYRDLDAAANSGIASAVQNQINRDSNFGVTYRRVIGSNAVNEAIFNFSNFRREITVGATLPDVGISGYTGIGSSSNLPQAFTNKYFQFLDNYSWVKGGHTVKFGGEFLDTITTGFAYFSGRGIYAFQALPAPYGTTDALTNFRMGRAATFTRGQGDFARRFQNYDMSFYLQDDWKIRPNLTLNLGVRYDLQLAPNVTAVTNGTKAFAAFDPTNKQYTDYKSDTKNASPVFGFAWDPFGKGKTSLRGGYRLAFDRIVQDLYNIGSILQPPFVTVGSVQLPAVSSIPLGGGEAVAATQGLPVSLMLKPHTQVGYAHSYQFSWQQQIAKGFVTEIGYLGTAGRSLNQPIILNRIMPGTTVRPDTKFGQITLVGDDGYSNYNGLTSMLQYRPNSNIAITAAYTFSKALDIIHDSVAPFGGASTTSAVVADPLTGLPNNQLEYGRAVFDRPHAFSSSFVFRSPTLVKNKFAGIFLNGFQLSGIVLLQSGNPFLIIAGADLNRDGVNNDRPDLVDPSIPLKIYNDPNVVIPKAAFNGALTTAARVGTLGRNVFRRDGVKNLDLAIAKRFTLTERFKFEFRGELFNTFNRTQFDQPNGTLSSATFGQITAQANSPRNIRFALRFFF